MFNQLSMLGTAEDEEEFLILGGDYFSYALFAFYIFENEREDF